MTAPHDKLAFKQGERYRMQIEFTADDVTPINRDGTLWFQFSGEELESAQIERIEPPLKVGDRVRRLPSYHNTDEGVVLHVEWDQVAVRWPKYLDAIGISDLERIA